MSGHEAGLFASSRSGSVLDRVVKQLFGNFQSRHVVVGALLALLSTTVGITSWLLVSSSDRIVERVLFEVAARVQQESRHEIDYFLQTPDLINHRTIDALRAGRVVDRDDAAMQRLFRDSARHAITAISGIYYASAEGRFTGFDAVSPRWPPDEWRYASSSPSTGGSLLYLPVDDGGEIRGMPYRSGPYDPRSRPWFVDAIATDTAVWSTGYADVDNGAATLTRAMASRDDDGILLGVAGVDLFLDRLQRSLAELDAGPSGEVFLVEGSGTLLGWHAGHHRGPALATDLRPASEADGRFTRAAAMHVQDTGSGFSERSENTRERLVLDGERGWLSLSAVGREQGVDWTLGVFVPESDYLAPLLERLERVLPLAFLTLLISALSFAVFMQLVVKPLRQLSSGATRIAVGEFDVPIDTSCGNEVGDLARAIAGMRDSLRRSFAEIVEQKLRAEITLASITDGVIAITAEGTVRYMNPVAERLTGLSLDAARDQDIETIFRARDERTDAPLTRALILGSMADSHAIGRAIVVASADGDTHLVHCRVSPIVDATGLGLGAVLDFSDLSEELRLKSELVHQATHDALTNLTNRREFERRLTRAVEKARRRDSTHVLCYIDLDQFKLVNDSAGHEAGDELLRQVARLLDESVRGGDSVGRLGGDEFGVLLENCTLEQAALIVETLRERFESFRFLWEGRGHGIGISAGLVAIGPDSSGMVAVMRDADSACYIAKESGRNRIHVHHDNDERLARLRGDRSWIERIEAAFEHDRFALHAQRIETADPDAGPHRHVEILLRLFDESGDALSPAAFLPAAERYNLASRIDRWVVTNTLDWLASLPEGNALPELCSINLSGQSLGEEAILGFIVGEIRRTGVSASRLCFEVTETATIANLTSALGLIETLRELGCSFALDDFGSGLSSFAYLKTLPVDYLKIDGVFVRDMLDDPLDRAMVRSINEVGQTMGMRTIAEYVENDALRRALHEIGIDYVQGYGIGRPEPLDTLVFPLPLSRASGG